MGWAARPPTRGKCRWGVGQLLRPSIAERRRTRVPMAQRLIAMEAEYGPEERAALEAQAQETAEAIAGRMSAARAPERHPVGGVGSAKHHASNREMARSLNVLANPLVLRGLTNPMVVSSE